MAAIEERQAVEVDTFTRQSIEKALEKEARANSVSSADSIIKEFTDRGKVNEVEIVDRLAKSHTLGIAKMLDAADAVRREKQREYELASAALDKALTALKLANDRHSYLKKALVKHTQEYMA